MNTDTRVSDAIALIGPPWTACLDESTRNAARRHMAVCAANSPLWTPAELAIQGLRRVNVVARSSRETVVVPSDQWKNAYA